METSTPGLEPRFSEKRGATVVIPEAQAAWLPLLWRSLFFQTAIRSVRFELGCRDYPKMGMVKFDTLTQAIKGLDRPIVTKHLRIDFLPFCFFGDRHLASFIDALKDEMYVDYIPEILPG